MNGGLQHAIDIPVVELERIAALGWPGTRTGQLGEWLLREGGGFTGRANSVLPLGSPGCELDEAIGVVIAHYRAIGLPPKVQLPSGVPRDVELAAALGAAGWQPSSPVAVMVADLPAVLDVCPRRPDLPAAVLAGTPSTDWIDGYRYRGGAVPATGLAVLTAAARPVFATVSDARGRMAVARGVVDEGWLGVTAVTVEPDRRRIGLGTHILAELVRWASAGGARFGYLQVDAANSPALELYSRLGFRRHHDYCYWDPDPVAATR